MATASVCVEKDDTGRTTMYGIKIGTDAFEINVEVPEEDVPRLAKVRRTPWVSGSLRIGTVAEAAAWWSVSSPDEGPLTLNIVVGHDDETWDFGVTLAVATLDEILREIEEARRA